MLLVWIVVQCRRDVGWREADVSDIATEVVTGTNG